MLLLRRTYSIAATNPTEVVVQQQYRIGHLTLTLGICDIYMRRFWLNNRSTSSLRGSKLDKHMCSPACFPAARMAMGGLGSL